MMFREEEKSRNPSTSQQAHGSGLSRASWDCCTGGNPGRTALPGNHRVTEASGLEETLRIIKLAGHAVQWEHQKGQSPTS